MIECRFDVDLVIFLLGGREDEGEREGEREGEGGRFDKLGWLVT